MTKGLEKRGTNSFSSLSNLNGKEFAGLTEARDIRPRFCTKYLDEAWSIQNDIKIILRDKTTDVNLVKLLRNENKLLGGEIRLARRSPKRLLSERMAAIEARILRIKGVSPTKWGSATVVTEEDGISERYVSESCEIDEASENGLYKKGTEVDVFSPPKIEGEGRKANSDVVHADVDGSETFEKGSEPDETELVDEVIDGNEVGDDDDEEDEDSSVGGEDKVGDDPSRDVVPVIIGTEDGGKYNKSEQRSAPSLPLEKGIYFSESTTASELFCSQSMCVADVLSPDNMEDWRKIQIGEKEGPLGHAYKVLDGMPPRVSATKSHSRAYKVGGKLSVFNPRPSENFVKLNTGVNVLNVDAGNEKGDWLSGKQDPKVANCDNFVGEHHMLDEIPKQGRVDKPHKMGLISDSRSDEEGQNAIGKYGRCTKDTRKIRGVEKVAPMSHALKVFDGKHKPSSLVVDQDRKWADVVAGAQSKGPAANQTQESISKGMELEYISDNGSGIIDIEDDMIDEKPWIYCVVGYFLAAIFHHLVQSPVPHCSLKQLMVRGRWAIDQFVIWLFVLVLASGLALLMFLRS